MYKQKNIKNNQKTTSGIEPETQRWNGKAKRDG